jgi:hypothetical protein
MSDVIYFGIFASPYMKDTIPLYDDNDDLIGGAAPDTDKTSDFSCYIQCFVAAKGHPVSLNLTSDLPVYVQLIEENGFYKSGKVTIVPPVMSIGESYYLPQNVR